MKSEKQNGEKDPAQALQATTSHLAQCDLDAGSAREARTQFETGFGDALVTYELEGLLMKEAKAQIDVVIPKATIFSEHPGVVIDKNISDAKRPVINAFMEYLWSDEAQRAFVQYHFRSITNEALNESKPSFK
jgi:sulfate transport system substrate-binding protein